jgi:hypothetical protein
VLFLVALAVTAGNPWAQARVGDAVEYQFSSEVRIRGEKTRHEARLALEVIGVDGGVVSVRATAGDRAFQIDVLAEPSPVQRQPVGLLGEPTRVEVDGGVVTCRAWVTDQTQTDGPRTTVCESSEPPLYLADGAARTHVVFHGMRGSSEFHTVLTSLRRGSGLTAGVPKLSRLPQQGWAMRKGDGYHEVQEERFVGGRWLEVDGAFRRVMRTREDLKRTDLIHLRDGWFKAETPGVHDQGSLLDLLGEIMDRQHEPDWWSPKLDGLPFRLRLHGHGDVIEWGAGPPPGPTAMGDGELPDELTTVEIQLELKAISESTQCLAARREQEKTSGGNMPYDYLLKLKLANGRVLSAALKLARLPTDYPAPFTATTRCLEGELLKHSWPKTNPLTVDQEVRL